MSNFQPSGRTGREKEGEDNSFLEDVEEPQTNTPLQYKKAGNQKPPVRADRYDPYKGMIQLRELLRGGQITKAEYEAAKINLLFDDE